MPNHYHFLIQVRTLESLNEKDFIQDELPRTNEEIQKRLNETISNII
jgi:hypothetical protein